MNVRGTLALIGMMLSMSAHAYIGEVHQFNVPQLGLKPGYIYLTTTTSCAECTLYLTWMAGIVQNDPKLKVILLTQKDSPEWRQYTRGLAHTFETLFDSDGRVLKALNIAKVPSLIFAELPGSEVTVYTGKFDNTEIQQIVSNNLAGKSQARYFSPGQVGSSALPIAGVDLGPRDVLVFHSTHCPYCAKQMPDVLNYARSNPNVNVWVITAIQISKPEELEAQFKGHPANLKLISSKDPMPFMQYNIQGTPTNLWVRDGKIVQAKTGYNPETFKGSGF